MKRIILGILAITLLYACTDVLDKGPLNEVTEDEYWTTSSDLKLYLNQFYPSFGQHINYYSMDSNSDNAASNSPSEVLDGTRAVPGSGGGWSWGNIRDINYFFENAFNVTQGDQTKIDQYIGEGYFFKAYFYFQKLKRFGAVPIYDKVLTLNSEGLKAPRDPRNEVADSIIANLDRAISRLPVKSQTVSNRVNKESAILFKSRVALYEGTWEKYHQGTEFGVEGSNGQKYLKIAENAAAKLVNNNQFSIYSTGNPERDYWKLFNRTELSNNPETILSTPVEPEMDLGSFNWAYLLGTRAANGWSATKQLVDSYLAEDGRPIGISSKYKGDTTIVQTVRNRDPRLRQTIWVPGTIQLNYPDRNVNFDQPVLVGGGASTTGYMIRKGSTTDPEQNSGASSDERGATDGFVFRYAEALLNYAEAKAELGTLTQDDLDKTVNLLRDRVDMPHLTIGVGYTDPNWNFPSLSPIINEIRRERRIELALEGFRYDDLMRWAAADHIQGMKIKGARFIKGESFPPEMENDMENIKVDGNRYISPYKNSVPDGFGFNESRDYLYPIPEEELAQSENLIQNPGWE